VTASRRGEIHRRAAQCIAALSGVRLGRGLTLPPFGSRRAAPWAAQTEKAFQKQPTVALGYKKIEARKGKKAGLPRWTRNVGLGFKTPETAVKVRPSPRLPIHAAPGGARRRAALAQQPATIQQAVPSC
jgi:hypothetical protein